jgi:hypothetical protein
MADEWVMLCQADDLTVEGSSIQVRLGESRRQRVTVNDDGQSYALGSIVVRAATASALPDVVIKAWLRNRGTHLVGFRVDERGRLVGEAWVPKAGLSASEFQHYVRTVAIECDRFGYTLTGRDAD